MFSRFQRFYNSIKVATDLVVLTVAFSLAYFTRFHSVLGFDSIPPLGETLVTLAMALLIFPLTYQQASLYTTSRSRTHLGEVFEIFKATVFATIVLLALINLTRDRYSRVTIAFFATYAFVLVALTRVAFRQALHELRRRGFNLKSIVLVGDGELARRVIATIEHHRELGFRVVGALTPRADRLGMNIDGVAVVGLLDEVDRVVDATIDQVIIALPTEDQPLLKPLMDRLALRTVDVKVVPDLYQYITLWGGLEEFGGLPIISLQGGPLQGWNLITKRACDVVFALVALLLISPVMIAAALLVKLTSLGPVFYLQERMGMDGRTFHMLKFRTMRTNAESSGPRMASHRDERLTAVGQLMRKLSIDELPQFFNVLVGDMSLVGPRPERPFFIEEFKRQIPKYHLRHMVKSGITGWAQVHGLRGQTSIKKRIEYDLYYIENWSLLLDFKILVRTALGGFLSRNAY